MGKRSSFERVPRDFYPTPYEAVFRCCRTFRRARSSSSIALATGR
jgi:hypothetical protein